MPELRHVVLVSQIPMWSMGSTMGGPAFERTIRALAGHYRLTVIAPQLDYVSAADFPDGVTVHTFRHRLHGAFRSVRKLGWVFDTLAWFTFQYSAWRLALKVCATEQVDAVYGYEIYGVPVARRIADKLGVPMVARYQGTLMSDRKNERLWRLRYLKHVRALRTVADLYIMTNDGTRGREVLLQLGARADRIRFWLNGVDKEMRSAAADRSMARAQLGFTDDEIVVLTVSRLSGWKRVDRAIDVVDQLVTRGHAARLLIVGVGPKESSLRAYAAKSAAPMEFVGGVERERLSTYYRAADLLLSLYDHSNVANPVLEAMLLGTVVAALDVGGTRDLITDGANGVLLDDSDVRAIAERLDDLLRDRDMLDGLGHAGAAWAEEHLWTWDQRLAAELTAIDRIIDNAENAR